VDGVAFPWSWFLGMRGRGGLSLNRGFWRRVDMGLPWSVVPGGVWTRWSFLWSWFLEARECGGLFLVVSGDAWVWWSFLGLWFLRGCGGLLLWFLEMRERGGLSLVRGSWGCVDGVVFPWVVVPGDAWTGVVFPWVVVSSWMWRSLAVVPRNAWTWAVFSLDCGSWGCVGGERGMFPSRGSRGVG